MKTCVEWRDSGPLLGLVLTFCLAQVSFLQRNRLFTYKCFHSALHSSRTVARSQLVRGLTAQWMPLTKGWGKGWEGG